LLASFGCTALLLFVPRFFVARPPAKNHNKSFGDTQAMLDNLKIGTRLMLAFGGLALVVALLMVMALAGIGDAEQSLQGGTMAAAQLQ
jgi:hypothetical protein